MGEAGSWSSNRPDFMPVPLLLLYGHRRQRQKRLVCCHADTLTDSLLPRRPYAIMASGCACAGSEKSSDANASQLFEETGRRWSDRPHTALENGAHRCYDAVGAIRLGRISLHYHWWKYCILLLTHRSSRCRKANMEEQVKTAGQAWTNKTPIFTGRRSTGPQQPCLCLKAGA